VRWQAIVHRRTYDAWPRVRIPIRVHFVENVGKDWLPLLRQRLARVLRLDANAEQLEIVQVHAFEDEIARFTDRRAITAHPHHTKGMGADPEAALLCIDSLQELQWYGELVSIQEPVWIMEVALSPHVDTLYFVQAVNQALRCKASRKAAPASSGTCSIGEVVSQGGRIENLHLNEVIPRQVERIFAWPAAKATSETVSGLLDFNMAIEHIVWLEWKEGHREAFWKRDISRLVKPTIYLACSVVQLSSAFVAYLVFKESDVDDFLDMHDETMPFFASQDQARIYNSALRYGERQSAVPETPVMKPFMGIAHKLP